MARIEGTRLSTDGIYYPVLPVEIVLPEEATGQVGTVTVRTLAIVDTGANESLVPASLLEPAGVVFDDLPDAGSTDRGVGSTFETRKVPGSIIYDGVTFIETEFEVCAPGMPLPFPLLGRQDFFQYFRVAFEWHKEPPRMHVAPLA